MRKIILLSVSFLLLINTAFSYQHLYSSQLPMKVHSHKKPMMNMSSGMWMFSVKYMPMYMAGLGDGASGISRQTVFDRGYMVSPINMSMNMTMLSVMYMTSKYSVMLMAPYLYKKMEIQSDSGQRFTTRAKGLGDTTLKGDYSVYKDNQQNLMIGAGVSMPTGSINNYDTGAMGYKLLPYPMQLGSGTFDPLVDVNYTYYLQKWTLGAQGKGLFRVYKNYHQYALGNQYNLTISANRTILSWLSAYTHIDGLYWGNVRGADPQLNASMAPPANPDFQGGKRIDWFVGTALQGHQGIFSGQQLKIEFGIPVYQYLNGPMLRTRWEASIQWVLSL